jgi:hypothetical protein
MENILAILTLALSIAISYGFRRWVRDHLARLICMAFCFGSLMNLRDDFSSHFARVLIAASAAMALGVVLLPERRAEKTDSFPVPHPPYDEKSRV